MKVSFTSVPFYYEVACETSSTVLSCQYSPLLKVTTSALTAMGSLLVVFELFELWKCPQPNYQAALKVIPLSLALLRKATIVEIACHSLLVTIDLYSLAAESSSSEPSEAEAKISTPLSDAAPIAKQEENLLLRIQKIAAGAMIGAASVFIYRQVMITPLRATLYQLISRVAKLFFNAV
ncbi:MAG: hypothetical protein K9M07_01335 [Simkaniaceae bacterium]|nr:hypothetical protein [Simkaniaceae bacterium]